MLGVDQVVAPPPTATKKKDVLSAAMKRTSEWIFSHEIPSDITVNVGEVTFSLHKFPLVSKCGYIRKLVEDAKDEDIPVIDLSDIPGGVESFELAAKFCYGMKFEMSKENIALVRCVAEYLEMTEEYAVENLVSTAESYLQGVALISLSSAVTVLQKSEDLKPISEEVKLVSRCIDAISYIACTDNHFYMGTDSMHDSSSSSISQSKEILDWWVDELTVLKIETFQRVLMAMKARGFKEYALGPVLMLYAQKSLRGLDIFGRGRKKIEPRLEHEKRVVLETIVSLLPREKNALSVSFLSMLLRAAIYLETTVSCRLDLEKRMSLQLGHAVLDDLLIPSLFNSGETMFDVDTVQRILMNYLENEVAGTQLEYITDDDYISPPHCDIEQVGKLMESYLAEIASDPNLSISSFVGLAELVPEQARVVEDGMYRAVDIYLKAHPNLGDPERKKLCNLMDCQKLSREACAHAAQNDRLPVQIVVQVLYYEQQRFRNATSGNYVGGDSPASSNRTPTYNTSYNNAIDEISRLRRENGDLKLELVKLRMQLKEIERSSPTIRTAAKPPTIWTAAKPPLPKKSFANSVSKMLGRLVRSDDMKPFSRQVKTKPPKDRRYSIS